MRAVLLALALSACALTAGSGERDTNWRAQHPELKQDGCITVWIVGGLGCYVTDEDSLVPRQCVASAEPGILRVLDPNAECQLGFNNGCDCNNQVQEAIER